MSNTPSSFNPELWLPPMPEKELYEVYEHTLKSRFPIFGIRDFQATMSNLSLPLLTHKPDEQIDDSLLHMIVQPDSFTALETALQEHAEKYGIQSWLEHEGSVVYVTDHGQFTDVPVVAEAIGRINITERARTVQVMSKMISLMTLNLGDGPFVVMDKLRAIGNAVQTVPRLEGHPSKELRDYRTQSNTLGVLALQNALDQKGTVVVESFIGRHNHVSESGKTIYIHEPNLKTAEHLAKPHVKVVPIYLHCPTFGKNGSINPAYLHFSLHEPMHITNPKNDARQITEFFRDATKQTYGNSIRVLIRSWARQKGEAQFKQIRSALMREGATDSEY